jgi:hypothetical protein
LYRHSYLIQRGFLNFMLGSYHSCGMEMIRRLVLMVSGVVRVVLALRVMVGLAGIIILGNTGLPQLCHPMVTRCISV